MKECSLPFIALPNDQNQSDVTILLNSGELISASDLMKRDPIVKDLISSHIKLMADDPLATANSPEIRIVQKGGNEYVSVSFFCSQDVHGRKTSASLVFELNNMDTLPKLLRRREITVSIREHRDELLKFLQIAGFKRHLKQNHVFLDPKKKDRPALVIGLVVAIFVVVLISLKIVYF